MISLLNGPALPEGSTARTLNVFGPVCVQSTMSSVLPRTLLASTPFTNTSYMRSPGDSLSLAGSQSSQASGGEVSGEKRRLVGAVGATVSVARGVVTESGLLRAAFPNASLAITSNV